MKKRTKSRREGKDNVAPFLERMMKKGHKRAKKGGSKRSRKG